MQVKSYIPTTSSAKLTKIKKITALLFGIFLYGEIYALPVLDNIANGEVSVQNEQLNLQINQTSNKAILNWESFNISTNEGVHFQQPANGVCLNRIDATKGTSLIDGSLSATANIYLINQAGILFGETATLNVGGIISAAADLSDKNFLAENIIFEQGKDFAGSIINRGVINIAEGGLAAFLGSSVVNDGVVNAKLSSLTFASGSSFRLIDLFGGELLHFAIESPTNNPGLDEKGQQLPTGVNISGTVLNEAGQVYVSARAVDGIFDNLINMDGVIRAQSIQERPGIISLLSDEQHKINVTGVLDTSSEKGAGGIIIAAGGELAIEKNAQLISSGHSGGGAILLGDFDGPIESAIETNSVYIGPQVVLNADAKHSGNGGAIIINSSTNTSYRGQAQARGGEVSGDGGFIEISGQDNWYYDEKNASVDTSAKNGAAGEVLFDPKFLVIQSSGSSNYANTINNLFNNNPTGTNTLSPISIQAASGSSNIVLQANSDVIFNEALSLLGNGKSLTVNAGRSVLISNSITTNNGAVTVIANDVAAQSANRSTTTSGNPAGDSESVTGNITMGASSSINAGTGNVTFTIGSSTTSPFSPGNITLYGLTGGNVTLSTPNSVIGNSSINASGIVGITVGASSNINGVISGTDFNKNGLGTLLLNNSNTLTGIASINQGALKAGVADVMPNINRLILEDTADVIFDLNNFNQSIGDLVGGDITGGSISLGSAYLTVNETTNRRYDGIISGTGGLIKQGPATLTITAEQTYTGTTTINEGTLRTLNANIFPTQSDLIIADNATARLNLANTNQEIGSLSGGGVSGGLISLGSGNLTIHQNSNQDFAGQIEGTGSVLLDGSAVLTISGANTYTGSTNLLAGTLRAGNANVIANSSPVTMANDAVLDLNDYNQLIGTLSGSGEIHLGNAVLSVNQGALDTYSGTISGTGGILKEGNSTLVLSGNNTYTGTTQIDSGKLQMGVANAIVGPVELANVNGAVFDLNNFDQNIANLTGGGNLGGNVILGNATLTIEPSVASTYEGIISGTGGVTLDGKSILSLSAANTYTGQTTINAGTLKMANHNVLPSNSAVTFANNVDAILDLDNFNQSIGALSGAGGNINLGSANLTINQLANSNFVGAINGSGSVIKNGPNTLTLSGSNTYTGQTTINAGILQAGSTDTIASTSKIILSNTSGVEFDLNDFDQHINNLSGGGGSGGNISLGTATLYLNQNALNTYAGEISGTGGITLNGTASFVLSGTNSYSGPTTINSGILEAGAGFVIPDDSAVIIANSASAGLDLNNFSQSIGSLSGGGINGGNIVLGSAVLTIKQTADDAYAGVISGLGRLVMSKPSTNRLTLSGINTYSGGIELNGGTLRVASDANIGAAPLSVTASSIKFNGGTLEVSTGFTLNANRGINLDVDGGSLQVAPTQILSYNGIIDGIGAFTKTDTGMLILGGINTYSGATNINAGVLRTNANNAIANSSSINLVNDASVVFDLNNFNQTIGALSGGGLLGGNISLGTADLTINQAVNDTYAGVINGSGGLVKNGTAALTLSGTNTYTGSTTINAGSLRAGVVNTISASSSLNLANVSLAKFDLNNFDQNIGTLIGGGASGGNITLGSATLTINQSIPSDYYGIISGSGGISKNGTGDITLYGMNTYTGNTQVNAGVIHAGATDIISGSNLLNLANVVGVEFDLNGFDQTINNLAGGGNSGGNINLVTANLAIDQDTANVYAGVISGSGGVTKNGNAALTLTGANSYTGTTSINAGAYRAGAINTFSNASPVVLANASTAVLDLNSFAQEINGIAGGGGSGGNVALGSAALTINQNVPSSYAGIINGSGSIIKEGSDALTLSGNNAYSGITQINAGMLRAGDVNVFAPNSAVNLADVASAALDLNGFNQTISTLSGGGSTGGNIDLGAGILLINQKAPSSYDGIISGDGNVVLYLGSTDTLTLTGINTYTGSTSVRAGKLQIASDNNLGTAPLTPMVNHLNLNGGVLETSATFAIDSNRGIMLGANDGTIQVDPTYTLTYNGITTGTGSITKTGDGTLVLGGNNTFTGATILQEGAIIANAADVVADSSVLTLANVSGVIFDLNDFDQQIGTLSGGGAFGGDITLGSAALTINQDNLGTYDGVISGTGGVTKDGIATLVLNGANTYSGDTIVADGNLEAGATNVIPAASHVHMVNAPDVNLVFNNYDQTIDGLSGGGVLGGNLQLGSANLTITQDTNADFGGIISGSGGVTLNGLGVLTLSGANTYTGPSTITSGTIKAGNNNVIASTSDLILADSIDAVFDLNDFDQSVGTLSGGGSSGGNILLGQGTLTVNESADSIYAGEISDFNGGGFTLNGSATLTLSGQNIYTGDTTVNSGKLKAANTDVIAYSNALILANTNGTEFDLNDFDQIIGSLSGGGGVGGNVKLGSATLTINQDADTTFAGVISGTGNVEKTGTAALILGNVNSYTGTTTIDMGTLRAAAVNTISTSSPLNIDGGALFDLNGNNQILDTVFGTSGMGVNVLLGGATLELSQGADLVIQ